MTKSYEFRVYIRTQRVHIFESGQETASNLSLCGEIKQEATVADRAVPLSEAKKYAKEHSYTCQTCAEMVAKLD